jgi:hypothetical protein
MKNEKVVFDWVKEAYLDTLSKGLTIHIKIDKLVLELMSDRYLFNTNEDEKTQVFEWINKMFNDFEIIVNLINQGKIRESNLRIGNEITLW